MAANKPWFVLAGGGTGGHLYPGLAIAETIQAIQPDFEVAVFGTPRPIDAKLTAARGYELVQQGVRPMPSKPWHWPGFLKAWFQSVAAAKRRFRERPPAIVLGLGGYAAGPPVVAAASLKIPTAIFNPDAVPGKANKRLSSKVNCVFVQWEETKNRLPRAKEIICSGCPVRASFAAATRRKGCKSLKLDPDRPTLLVTGASQGAHSINATAVQLIDLWRVAKDWQIVHLTGASDLEWCRKAYGEAGVDARTYAFTEHMAYCMAASDLVISRAGASTLAEITAMGLPSILLPYPYDKHKHQLANAKVLAEVGAAAIIEDTDDAKANARQMHEVLRQLMRSDESRRRMALAAGALGRTDAADMIADQLLHLARED